LSARAISIVPDSAAQCLADWCRPRRRLVVLTGAGCSTDSGISDYRDQAGAWKRKPPVQHREFVGFHATRQRYWARSLLGWRHFSKARPNLAHLALARLEAAGRVSHLITQNVDGLHQQAGSRAVTDLHGRLDQVECLGCKARILRTEMQRALELRNPEWSALSASHAPDGDADLEALDFSAFDVPACQACGGVLKPAVVFFGDSIPATYTHEALDQVQRADALLVVGSSLMVWSGFRLVREAAERGIAVAALNLGLTRADGLLHLKLMAPCGDTLSRAAGALGA
jgi:NAD-dependent SIR2 family protein deacetylase